MGTRRKVTHADPDPPLADGRAVAHGRGMAAVVGGLHVVGFFLLLAVVAPHRYSLGAGGAFTVGVGVTAYTLGMRHAFDADHISAIDNTTRKLMHDGQRPLSVGFFFSLGHSTVVFVLAFLLSSASGAGRAGAGRRLDPAHGHRPDRDRRVGDVPLRDRRAQPRDPGGHRARLPRHAPRRPTTRPSWRPSCRRAG